MASSFKDNGYLWLADANELPHYELINLLPTQHNVVLASYWHYGTALKVNPVTLILVLLN